MKINPFTT